MDTGRQDIVRLVETYSDMILRLSYTYLRSRADADDICQEVFLKAIHRPEPFESTEHERAWLTRVTINACMDLLRRRSAHTVVDLDDVPESAAPECASEEAADERARSVLAAVQSLKLSYRSSIYLYYFEGLSVSQIAEATGSSKDTVSQRLSRGRTKLRKILGEGGEYELNDYGVCGGA